MPEFRISFLLNSLVKELNSQADALLRQRFDITYSQFVFLLVIEENSKIDVTRLAQSLGVTVGAVSKRLNWFTERNLVETFRRPDDSKRIWISLTGKGINMTKSAGTYLEKEFLEAISQSQELKEEVVRSELQKMHDLLVAKREVATD